jgi:hypothetical protein
MQRKALRAVLAALVLTTAISGCSVTAGDIDHWKRTIRGPGKITRVLVEPKYDRALRVLAAKALIEMKHPNANGLELLTGALGIMPVPDREGIIHDLLPALRNQMRGVGQQQTNGPTEQMIRAKDAAYLLLRFASEADRREISNELLSWILSDLNSRALAGQYTAEQVVQAIGAPAGQQLAESINSNEDTIRVMNNIAQLVNTVGTDAAKDAATTRMVAVCAELTSPAANARIRQSAERLVRAGAQAGATIDAARIDRATERLRDGLLAIMQQGISTLNRPAGTAYFIASAADAQAPLERRKTALAAVQGQVRREDATALLALATAAGTDIELRGLAVDRLGETRNADILPQLWTIFDSTNGGETNNEYVLRWKVGEAALKLGGAASVPTFVQHVGAVRATPRGQPAFEGYTFREINGFAVALGDFSVPQRDVMRQHLTSANVHVRALAILYLGNKGDASDAARLEALQTDQTAIAGPGWATEQLTNIGAVARRAREALRRALVQGRADGGV